MYSTCFCVCDFNAHESRAPTQHTHTCENVHIGLGRPSSLCCVRVCDLYGFNNSSPYHYRRGEWKSRSRSQLSTVMCLRVRLASSHTPVIRRTWTYTHKYENKKNNYQRHHRCRRLCRRCRRRCLLIMNARTRTMWFHSFTDSFYSIHSITLMIVSANINKFNRISVAFASCWNTVCVCLYGMLVLVDGRNCRIRSQVIYYHKKTVYAMNDDVRGCCTSATTSTCVSSSARCTRQQIHSSTNIRSQIQPDNRSL